MITVEKPLNNIKTFNEPCYQGNNDWNNVHRLSTQQVLLCGRLLGTKAAKVDAYHRTKSKHQEEYGVVVPGEQH